MYIFDLNQLTITREGTMSRIVFFLTASVCLLFSFVLMAQQNLTTTRVSNAASVSQTIGLTEIEVNYSRPYVNGRTIWGALVPYNQVWRAGANENTTIRFSHDVKIGGKNIPAGTYGLHMIPTEGKWTIIFNKDHEAWGSFFYDESRDQTRFETSPLEGDFQESLIYTFDDLSNNSATLNLRWAELVVPMKIELDINRIVLENMKKELTSLPGFFWQGWNQIAAYAWANDLDLNDALGWADRSIGINENFTNSMTKVLILESLGKTSEANQLKEKYIPNATEAEINALGYQYLFAGKTDPAIELFKMNTEDHPDSWNVWDSLGEGYAAKGEKKLAIKNYKKAHEMAPANQKARIEGILKNLE